MQSPDAHANITVYGAKSGLIITLGAKRLPASGTLLNAGAMLFDLRSDNLLLEAFQNQVSLKNRQPTVAGEISSERSIEATSCSMASPGTASTTSFIVHLIPPAYPTRQLCMLSTQRTIRRLEALFSGG
jgi:hypothetical protein